MIDRWKLYDLIYAKADRLLKQYNPCNIHLNKNKQLICNNPKYNFDKPGQQRPLWNELCCMGCNHLGNNGCTIKCLGCKVGLCFSDSRYHIGDYVFDRCCSIIKANKVFRTKIHKLIKLANKYELVKLHAPKTSLNLGI